MEGFGIPNFFSYFMYFAWVPLALVIFAVTKKPLKAVLIVYLGGILFLPERIEYDFPLIPPIAKGEIAALACLLGAMLKLRKRLFRLPKGKAGEIFIPVIMIGALVTASNNETPIVLDWYGEVVLPGHDFREGIALGVRELFAIGVPYFLGRMLFREEEDLKMLVSGLAVAGLVYVPFIMFELRMSPQLHNITYGFFQHYFNQTIRWGGYRPMVYMQHGLAVAMMMLGATMAAFSCAQGKIKIWRFRGWGPAYFLFVMLVLCKSTAAIILALLCLPMLKWAEWKRPVQLLYILIVVIVIYPTLKITDTFPDEGIVNIARTLINEERAQSVEFRFQNDEILVERAREKLWFGWGSYGRGRVYDETGRDISVTDGYWIIQLGARGVVGLYANFGLLVIPLWLARKRIKKMVNKEQRALVIGLALILAMFTVDLLPNGLYNSIPFFLAGALATLSSTLGAQQRSARPGAVMMQNQQLRRAA